ncbi:MAG: YhcH/YjgK/YiaL family protein [Clostridia bacterium]|nr:YhcH/YjgK/YiaL family protein [Clostridia bacterium]
MILDKISKLNRYAYVPGVEDVVNFLNAGGYEKLEVGSYKISDLVTLKVQSYLTKEEPEELLLEAHREYLDLQMTVSGSEIFLFQSIDLGEDAIPYNPQKDVEFFTAPYYNTTVLDGTNFAIVFPNDLHNGSFMVDEQENVKKFVFKLKI